MNIPETTRDLCKLLKNSIVQLLQANKDTSMDASKIQIYPERQANGQWLKSIKFKLPIIEEDISISLDNEEQIETVVLLRKAAP